MQVATPRADPGLRFLCDALAHDGAAERDRRIAAFCAATPDWPRLVWQAGCYGVTPALHGRLARRGLLRLLPGELADYLAGAAALNRERNGRLLRELAEVAGRLNALGLRPLAMKGAANLLAGLYPDPGERHLLDLDLLLPAGSLPLAFEALRAAGWRQVGPAGMTEHHLPALLGPGHIAPLELHGEPLDLPWRKLLAAGELLASAEPLAHGGATLLLPPPRLRLAQALAHGALADRALALGRLPLRDLDDVAQLAALPGAWDAADLARRFTAVRQAPALAAMARGARLLLGAPLPADDAAGTALLDRALRLSAQPRRALLRERLGGPWLLLLRSLGHAALRRRLLRRLADPRWYARRWRVLRRGPL